MTKKNNLKKVIFSAALILAGALTLGSCSKDDDKSTKEPSYVLSGTADGTQMVPAVAGTATGTITGTYDPNTGQLNYTVTWTGLTGTPIFGSIYTGASGEAGGTYGNPFNFDVNVSSTGTATGNYALTGVDAVQLINGGWYYSLSTNANPTGEIRGQIKATR